MASDVETFEKEASVEPSVFTALEYLEASGMTMVELSELTKLHIKTVRHALMGGAHKLNIGSAILISEAFGIPMKEIEWAIELTTEGRTPLTGGKYTIAQEVKHGGFCDTHHLYLPMSGKCDECAA